MGRDPLWSGPTALTATGIAPPGSNVSAINVNNTSLDAFIVDQTGTINALSNTGLSWVGPSPISSAQVAIPGASTSPLLNGSQVELFTVAVGTLLESVNSGGTWLAPVPLD